MRVYFSGSHGSGKSTLARFTSTRYSLPMISEAARMVLSERELQIDTMRCDMDLVDQYQTEVFNRQLLEESKYDSFVSDRCIIDNLAYSASHSRILPKLLSSSALKENLTILRKPDTLLIFVRPCRATLKNDGVREALTWDGVIAIDAQIKLLLEMFEIRYFQINTESMQERVRVLENIISLIK
jgi:adenylate kinase family enzyme